MNQTMKINYSIITRFVKRYRSIGTFGALLITGLFLNPLIFWPWSATPFELPRVWFILVWIDILAVIAIAKILFEVKLKLNKVGMLRYAALFVCTALASGIVGVNLGRSLWGNYWRLDGIVTLLHVFALCLVLLLLWQDGWRRPLTYAIGMGSAATSILSVLFGFALYIVRLGGIPQWQGAIGVTFGQPVFLAGYLLVTLPVLLYLQQTAHGRNERFFWLVCMILQCFAIVLTRSIAGIALLLLYTAALPVYEKYHAGRYRKLFFFATTFVILISLGFLLWQQMQVPASRLAEGRQRIFMKGILGFVKRPVLGWGWANFDSAFRSVDWPYKFDIDVYVDKAHSQLLEVLVTTGIAGFLAYTVFLWSVVSRLVHRYTKAEIGEQKQWALMLLSIFFLYLIHSQTNITSIAEEVIFWTVVSNIKARP